MFTSIRWIAEASLIFGLLLILIILLVVLLALLLKRLVLLLNDCALLLGGILLSTADLGDRAGCCGILGRRLPIIVVNRQLFAFRISIHKVTPCRGRDGGTIPVAVVLAVDSDIRNRVSNRVLHVTDKHECGDLVRNETTRRN